MTQFVFLGLAFSFLVRQVFKGCDYDTLPSALACFENSCWLAWFGLLVNMSAESRLMLYCVQKSTDTSSVQDIRSVVVSLLSYILNLYSITIVDEFRRSRILTHLALLYVYAQHIITRESANYRGHSVLHLRHQYASNSRHLDVDM